MFSYPPQHSTQGISSMEVTLMDLPIVNWAGIWWVVLWLALTLCETFSGSHDNRLLEPGIVYMYAPATRTVKWQYWTARWSFTCMLSWPPVEVDMIFKLYENKHFSGSSVFGMSWTGHLLGSRSLSLDTVCFKGNSSTTSWQVAAGLISSEMDLFSVNCTL